MSKSDLQARSCGRRPHWQGYWIPASGEPATAHCAAIPLRCRRSAGARMSHVSWRRLWTPPCKRIC